MDNLKLPAYPVIGGGGTFENGYDGFKPGFTKLELAALMIAQGMMASDANIKKSEMDQAANNCIEFAKAILEQANK